MPFGRVLPFLPAVQLVDHRQECIILNSPICHRAGVEIDIVKNTLPYRARRGDHNKQRLPAGVLALFHDLVEIAVSDGEELVNNDTVGIQTVQRVTVLSQGLELAHAHRKVKICFPLFHQGSHIGRLLVGLVENQPGFPSVQAPAAS